jgi:hypothetical protein
VGYRDVVVFDDLDESKSPAIEDGGIFVAHDEVVGKASRLTTSRRKKLPMCYLSRMGITPIDGLYPPDTAS